MQYNNIVFFIGDENLYELILNTSFGYKCQNLETKEVSYISKNPINISNLEWFGLSLNEIFNHIQINSERFDNSPLNNILTQKALKWYILLKKNNVVIPKKETIQTKEETIKEETIELTIETPKKKTRKKKID
jgi:hypothetical protein